MNKKTFLGLTAVVVLGAGGYIAYERLFANKGSSGEERASSDDGSAPLPPDESPFEQYQDSDKFPASFVIPKGTPKSIATLVDQCTTGAGVYYGSIGGLPSDFPKQEVSVACSAYLLEELARAGCSPKKSGAIYCNGAPVNKSSTFEVVVDSSLGNNVEDLKVFKRYSGTLK